MSDEQKPIKMQLPNKEAIRKGAHAHGMVVKDGAGAVPVSHSGSQYTRGDTVYMPLTRAAQSIGGGLGVTVTQPMFFSPTQTPQNWQIASKRREVYQWQVLENTEIISSDYTFKSITELSFSTQEIIEDTITGGLLHENIDCESILGATGQFRKPCRYSVRECFEKRCFGFASIGYWREVQVSEEHPMIVLDGKKYRHKLKLASNAEYRRKKGIPEGGDKKPIKYEGSLICRKEAQDVDLKDYLLCPISPVGKENMCADDSWMIGQLIADGTICNHPGWPEEVRVTLDKDEKHLGEIEKILSTHTEGIKKITSEQHGDGRGWRVTCRSAVAYDLYSPYITGKLAKKKLTAKAFELDKESRLHLLGGYFDGDGCFLVKQQKLVANNYSKDMADQLYFMLISCGINCSLNRVPLYGDHYPTDSEWCYRIIVPSSEVLKLQPYMRSNKIPTNFVPKKTRELRFFFEDIDGSMFLAQPIEYKKEFLYTGPGYDIQVDPEHAFVANGFVTSNCRFYYENEPKVAAAIDFYSQFPINEFKLECKKKKILLFYERLVKDLQLLKWLRLISHERFLLGDVFIFLDIKCPHCHGSGKDPDNPEEPCSHPDGSFRRIIVLNPDWIEVFTTVLADEPEIVLMPDDDLKKIIQTRQPKKIFDRLPEEVKKLVASGKPIRLDPKLTSHLKHNGVPYGTYGESMLRRLFTTLAYKTKLMTANWIVAERLILPVRVVKVGDKDRPAGEDDIAEITQQLSSVANDPNLTIVTHHAFDYEWMGATGKIHNITAEMELIGKEILDGLMLNQSLLNGEMTSYASAQIGAETMIRRLDVWRSELKEWVETNIFLPIAKMQGFIDEEASKEAGETVYMHPTLKWEDMNLRDNSNEKQMYIALNQNSKISDRTLLEYFDLNYDQEVERIREQQVMAQQNGMLPPGGPGGPGGGPGGPGGPMPGGAPGGPGGAPGGAPMGGDPMGGGGGMPMGGDMGGGMGGGMGGAPGGAPMAASSGKVYKKGKAPKAPEMDEDQLKAMQPVQIRLTQPESKLYRTIQAMRLPFPLYAQYKQWAPGSQQPFAMDFAFPNLRLDIEADGEKWHTSPDDKQSDNERDKKLAALGWTVIRFPESAINESIDQVQKVLHEAITEAMESQRKMQKKSSTQGPESYGVVYYEEHASSSDAISCGFTSYSKSEILDNQDIKTG